MPALGVQSTAVLAFADQAARLGAGISAGTGAGVGASAWPGQWVDDLPIELRNYRAVIWDSIEQRLLVLPMGKLPGAGGGLGALPAAVLKPNAASEFGPAFALESLGAVDAAQLRQPGRFKVLSGGIARHTESAGQGGQNQP